jgi:hypothetical protein
MIGFVENAGLGVTDSGSRLRVCEAGMDTYMQGSHEESIFILCEDDCAAYAPSSHTMGCHIAASIGWLGVEVTVRRSVALSSECWRDLEVMT